MSRKKQPKHRETIKTGVAQYAVICCNVIYHIKDVPFKRCKRCGKILKGEEIDEIPNSTDKS